MNSQSLALGIVVVALIVVVVVVLLGFAPMITHLREAFPR